MPEDKQVDGFIRAIQAQAHSSGIELRRFTAMPVVAHDFYSEVPFEIELDGPYFAVVRFFEQIGKMDRLVSVSGLNMANVKNPGQAKAKKKYNYASGESVVATCTASAFFSPKYSTTTRESGGGKRRRRQRNREGRHVLESCKCDFVADRQRMGAGPGRFPEAAPLRSPFASPIRGVVKPPARPRGNAGEQKPTAAIRNLPRARRRRRPMRNLPSRARSRSKP